MLLSIHDMDILSELCTTFQHFKSRKFRTRDEHENTYRTGTNPEVLLLDKPHIFINSLVP